MAQIPQASQSYENHRRYFPLYHLVALPILAGNVAVSAFQAVTHPSVGSIWSLLFALGVAAGVVAARVAAITVQDRVIGLEMRLRLAAVLPPELRVRIPELRIRHLVALRFAGDLELASLVDRCLRGELATRDEIKREIRHWRPDFVRA